jgi:hypothetical protein
VTPPLRGQRASLTFRLPSDLAPGTHYILTCGEPCTRLAEGLTGRGESPKRSEPIRVLHGPAVSRRVHHGGTSMLATGFQMPRKLAQQLARAGHRPSPGPRLGRAQAEGVGHFDHGGTSATGSAEAGELRVLENPGGEERTAVYRG